jgi:kynureninase
VKNNRGKPDWDLENDLAAIRRNFPILRRCTYLISNSLGAVPRQAAQDLKRFYKLWAEEGVSAWSLEWWNLAGRLGGDLASFLGADRGTVAMTGSATQSHWAALSTQFRNPDGHRNKILMTAHDFPSTRYAVSQVSEFMGWQVVAVPARGSGVDLEELLDHIDERTLFVAVSHVFFRTGYILDIDAVAKKAIRVGAQTLIDGYHAPGTMPVHLKKSAVDFYVGGCLKWLCGGPGNAFIYVNPETVVLEPMLTGWLAHKTPFAFDDGMTYAEGPYRFMSGTPPIPSFYAALAGLSIIREIGIEAIRAKSTVQTRMILDLADRNGFQVFSPREDNLRGGAVSITLPHAYQVKQNLEEKKYKLDFRKGREGDPDVIRIAPHFYTKDEEIVRLFSDMAEILKTESYRSYPEHLSTVT